MKVCVFCSSSDAVDDKYFEDARTVGDELGRRGDELVYGGSNVGLMGVVANHAADGGAKVTGVIPEAFVEYGVANEGVDEFIVTQTMRERKAIMEERSDAFVALAGGIGTLEEIMEVLTLKQLQFHKKPVIFLNSCGYYEPLIVFFRSMFAKRFAKPELEKAFGLCDTPEDVFSYLDSYQP